MNVVSFAAKSGNGHGLHSDVLQSTKTLLQRSAGNAHGISIERDLHANHEHVDGFANGVRKSDTRGDSTSARGACTVLCRVRYCQPAERAIVCINSNESAVKGTMKTHFPDSFATCSMPCHRRIRQLHGCPRTAAESMSARPNPDSKFRRAASTGRRLTGRVDRTIFSRGTPARLSGASWTVLNLF